ncbi:MAG: hypothetical protein H0T80_07785 [Betaproteobacteria bacterium]|nr:hypothetical protein [Betaproteobacteria bacterium]
MGAATALIGAGASALAVSAFATMAVAQALVVDGNCREGQPHGAYELKMGNGQLRVAGAFSNGKRTGSFLFWTASGARVAHLPFDDDEINGTVALWYPDKRDLPPKLEAAYAGGRLHGVKRSWHPNGRIRAEFQYRTGKLLDAKAFDVAGKPLPAQEARALAARDALADASYYASLDQIVRDNLPCKLAG